MYFNHRSHSRFFSRLIMMAVPVIVIISVLLLNLSGCSQLQSEFKDLKGDLIGESFTIDTFDNFGTLTMKTHGEKINIEPIIVEETTYNPEIGWSTTKTLSSAIDITIDGHQMTSCGDTCIFYESGKNGEGLKPEYTFNVSEINSTAEDITDNTVIAGMINKVKNSFGKPVIVVIKSQTGYPLYAFSGEDVYWEIPSDLPKCTLLNIDGYHLYIHRANYQIIDKALLD